MLDRLDDTIVAISSAPGAGLVGIVRLSGAKALSIGDQLAQCEDQTPLSSRPGFTCVVGEVRIDGRCGSLPAVFYIFREGKSYTREDMLEIHTLGSPPLLDMIRADSIVLGARHAEPGEFTARAFFNGTMNLVSAEAVGDLINAQSDTQLRAAREMMDGAFTRCIMELRDQMAPALGWVEAGIDFVEEPIEFITVEQLRTQLNDVQHRLNQLIAHAAVSKQAQDDLPRILLIGRPNVGKSSLVNCLSGVSRAICAAVSGTTRDLLSVPIRLHNTEAILIDSAGVDQVDDQIIQKARKMTLSAVERVDLLCVVIDGTTAWPNHLLSEIGNLKAPQILFVVNKLDLMTEADVKNIAHRFEHKQIMTRHAQAPARQVRVFAPCYVSALTGAGLPELRCVLNDALNTVSTTVAGESLLITQRQHAALKEAFASLARVLALVESVADVSEQADIIAFEMRETLDHLGAVTGQFTTEEMLQGIFNTFCIGK